MINFKWPHGYLPSFPLWGLVGSGEGGELLVPAQLDDPDSFPPETDVGSVEARCQEVPGPQCHQQPRAASVRLRLHGGVLHPLRPDSGTVPWLSESSSYVTSVKSEPPLPHL